jgi:hypothetical protein
MFYLSHITQSSLNRSITTLLNALSEKNHEKSKEAWNKNKLLQAWFRGQDVNIILKTGVPTILRLPPDGLVHYFRLAWGSGCIDIIKGMWDNNEILHDAMKEMKGPEAFQAILHDYTTKVMGISFLLNETSSFIQKTKKRKVQPSEDLISTKKIKAQSTEIKPAQSNACKAMSISFLLNETSSFIQENRETTSEMALSSDPQKKLETQVVSQDRFMQLTKKFEGLLANSQHRLMNSILEPLWENNPPIRALYRGEQLTFVDSKVSKVFSDEELLGKFCEILFSCSQPIIGGVWEHNKRLQDIVQRSNIEDSISLLKKVMDSTYSTYQRITPFMREYLAHLEKRENKEESFVIIDSLIDELKAGNQKKAKFIQSKIKLLDDSLNRIKGKSNHESEETEITNKLDLSF